MKTEPLFFIAKLFKYFFSSRTLKIKNIKNNFVKYILFFTNNHSRERVVIPKSK